MLSLIIPTYVVIALCTQTGHVSAVPADTLGISASVCEPVMPLEDYPDGAMEEWEDWTTALNDALADEAIIQTYSKCVAGAPAFTKLSLNAQEVLCSIMNSGFNTVYAKAFIQGEGMAQLDAINFINQNEIGSCGFVGLAAMLVQAGPAEWFDTVFDLYCFGEFRDDNDVPLPSNQQPREYLLKREDTPSPACDQRGCMQGATYLFVTSLRDAINHHILSQRDKTRSDYDELEKESLLPPVGKWFSEEGNPFGTLPDDYVLACKLLGLECKVSNACGEDDFCRGLYSTKGLFPKEQDEWGTMFEEVLKASEGEEIISPDMVEGDGYIEDVAREFIAEAVKQKVPLRKNTFINSLPIPLSDLTKHCTSGAILAGDASLIKKIGKDPDSYYCGYGAWGCGYTIPKTIETNHATFLKGCDKDSHICYLWSWGAIWKVRCDILAMATTSATSWKFAEVA